MKAPELKILFKNTIVGLGQEPKEEVMPLFIYPIPAKDRINVKFSAKNNQSVRTYIRDLSGRLLYSDLRDAKTGENELLFENLSLKSGMYFIQLQYDGKVQSGKFIIAK